MQNLRGFWPVNKETTEKMNGNKSNNVVHENEMLKHKVFKIEMENVAQQRRLQILEKMVMELTCSRSPSHVLDIRRHPSFSESLGRDKFVELTEGIHRKDEFEQDCMNNGNQLSGDVASLMEEFDRKGRENGLVYGMTHSTCSSSVTDSGDLEEARGLRCPPSPCLTISSACSENVSRSPLPSFLTPSYQQSQNSNLNTYSDNDPRISSPQLCLTTPVLLTTEALKEAEKLQDCNQAFEPKSDQMPYVCSEAVASPLPASASVQGNFLGKSALTLTLGSKVSPFSNLLAGWHQATHNRTRNHSNNDCWPIRREKFGNLEDEATSKEGFSSPRSSVSGRIRNWSHSLRLPMLSPLTESRCSDLETQASDEEDLVVDEVISLSMAGGSRQRSESFCSIIGPCISPDLLLDTKKASEELGVLQDTRGPTLKTEDLMLAEREEQELVCPVEDSKAGLEVTKYIELEGIKSQVIEEKAVPGNKILHLDGKDVKLPAGSIVLAMVNESGSLVPLPQLQVTPQSLSCTLNTTAHEKVFDEEIDIETVMERTPVLEAGDLDSLLAQFEASEAVNKPGGKCLEIVNERKNSEQPKSVGFVSSVESSKRPAASGSVSSNALQASPTHQNIKDALPKEIIEKIKASTKRKSTKMLSEPLIVHKGRGVKQVDINQPHSKAHRAAPRTDTATSTTTTTQQSKTDVFVPAPLDHDYCCSPEKQKKNIPSENVSVVGDGLFNKLPEYYTAIPRWDTKKPSISSDDGQDDGGKKDSGVESGDVSDASIETEERKKESKDSINACEEWMNRQGEETKTNYKDDVYNKLPAYMTDIGNIKPKEEPEGDVNSDREKERETIAADKPQVKVIKRKLNLSEYRQRIQSTQSSRCPSPAHTDFTQNAPSSTPLQVSELVGKMENVKTEKIEEERLEGSENNTSGHETVEDEMEEGELKGDSEPETTVNQDKENVSTGCVENLPTGITQTLKEIGIKTLDKSISVITKPSYSNSTSIIYDGRWKSTSRTFARRWSSSSRSRSRSRSPAQTKKHGSRKHRSRGKRRRTRRYSNSSQSPHSSSRRRWSRSRSRSLSRPRRRSSPSTCSSSCSSSRSRSRSSSVKTRDRWGYRFSRRSRSHSQSRSRSRSRSRSSHYSRVSRSRSPLWGSRRRSRSPHHRLSSRSRRMEMTDRDRQVEERRVIYIGRISEGTTKADLRHRFQKFGDIVDISVHFREHGDNYGFVTFKSRDEAYNAVEHGNDDSSLPRYDLCFGGRRAFCRVQYSDLDAQANDSHYLGGPAEGPIARRNPGSSMDFDSLLRAAMSKKTR
ncbi:uncharacterized protein [Procambarus clarkii]|uniref:uncharacterized protein isoform X2 n=1 Tax=Procambarus clarkii TaxID=6728 RepID=UPI003743F5C0